MFSGDNNMRLLKRGAPIILGLGLYGSTPAAKFPSAGYGPQYRWTDSGDVPEQYEA